MMSDSGKKKVIIADDSQTFLIYLAILLKRMGFKVIPAESGQEVLKLLKLVKPDAVMLDMYMEPVDGLAVLRCMKEDRETSCIPVIMLSVDSSAETIERCRRIGCAGYLTKPVRLSELNEALQELIFSPAGTKRSHLRVSTSTKIRLSHDGSSEDLYSESLSVGGIYIRKKDPFPVGSEVRITFPLNGGKDLHVNGMVIYTKELFGDEFKVPPGMAVKFNGMTEGETTVLKDHIDRLFAGDILDGQEEDVIRP
jgi:two-component system cell cycle response regulator/two-component system cell cycle response regulator DivK